MRIAANFQKYKIAIALFSIALGLRILNPTFGSPVLYINGDEPPNYLEALYILATGNPLFDTTIYPPFNSYIQIPFLLLAFVVFVLTGKVDSLDQLQFFLLTNQGYFLFVPRIIAAVFGALTVVVVYMIARLLTKQKQAPAVMAALFFAVSFNHVQISHFGRPWAGAIFFFGLSVWFVLKSVMQRAHEQRNALLSGIGTVLSFGFHQVGILGIWVFAVVRVFGKKQRLRKAVFNQKTVVSFAVMLAGIGAVMLLNSTGPQTGFFRDRGFFPEGYTFVDQAGAIVRNNNFMFQFMQFFLTEPVLFLLFVAAVVLFFRAGTLLRSLVFFAISTFVIVSFSHQQPRYQLPVFFIAAILGGIVVGFALEKISKEKLRVFAGVVLIVIAAVPAFMWNFVYLQKPTFIQAQEWIDQHIAPQEIILTTSLKFTGFTPAKDVLAIQQQNQSGFYAQAGSRLQPEEYPPNVRNIIYLGVVENINNKAIVPQLLEEFPLDYAYVLDLYWDPADSRLLYVDKENFEKVASFSPLKNKTNRPKISTILATVDQPLLPLLLQLERAGPYVDIYRRR